MDYLINEYNRIINESIAYKKDKDNAHKLKFEDKKLIYKPCIVLRFCEKMEYPP